MAAVRPADELSTPSRARPSRGPRLGPMVVGAAATFAALGALAYALGSDEAALPPVAVEPGAPLDLALIGGLFLLAVHNGLTFIPTRQTSYLLYTAMGVSLAVVYVTYFDSSRAWLGLTLEQATGVNHVASGLALALGVGFALTFLYVPCRRPRLSSVASGVAVGLALYAVLVAPWLPSRVAEVSLAVPGLFFPPALLALGIDAWRDGFRAARWYLAAWLPLLVVVLAAAVEAALGVQVGAGGRALLVANVAEMLLLALALTDRVKLAVEERERAQSERVRDLEDELSTARRLGPYTLGQKLGQGGMGVVYEAKHALLRRPTAVKLILPHGAPPGALSAFEREVHTMSRLTHPNTVTVYDYGRTEDGTLYYAMELLDGATLSDVIAVSGAQPPGRVARVLWMVAGALDEAHSVGLIHRDIKPGNIILATQGGERDVAKVVDFGLVKDLAQEALDPEVTEEAALAGTPLYMAPERLRDEPQLTPRSDLYALGAVGYFMLTGRPIFGGNSFQVMLRNMRDLPTLPSERVDAVPRDLEQLIMALLAKDPDDRPRDAAEAQRRLEACASFETWTHDDAARWWAEHADALAERRDARLARLNAEGSDPGGPGTFSVDVARRA